MNSKLIESLKNIEIEDSDLCSIVESAFKFIYFNSNIKNLSSIISNNSNNLNSQKAFSILTRIFKNFNTNKKLEEENLNNSLKEFLKGKNNSVNLIMTKIKEISSIQMKRNNFSDNLSTRHLNYFIVNKKEKFNNESLGLDRLDINNNLLGFISRNLYPLTNFSFKINIIISNDSSNRVLTPEIFLLLTLDNGKTITINVEMRVFQELRKCLAMSIKKIIDNESVNLLK